MNLHEILPMGNGTVFGQVCAKKKRDEIVKVDDPLENGRLGGDIRVMGDETDVAELTLSLLEIITAWMENKNRGVPEVRSITRNCLSLKRNL